MKQLIFLVLVVSTSVVQANDINELLAKYAISDSIKSNTKAYKTAMKDFKAYAKCLDETNPHTQFSKPGYDSKIFGTGNGAYQKCLHETKMHPSCINPDFFISALIEKRSLRVVGPNFKSDISGYGVNSQHIIFIGENQNIKVTAGEHSTFYYTDPDIDCIDDHFAGCRLSEGLHYDCFTQYRKATYKEERDYEFSKLKYDL